MSTLIETVKLRKYFPIKHGFIFRKTKFLKAVDGVDMEIREGETMGLAGESGCGKTTLGNLILGVISPYEGQVLFNGKPISENPLIFRRRAGKIFQNPLASLNPRKRIFQILATPLIFHNICDADAAESEVSKLLRRVGLSPPEQFMSRFPHELSGGQQQRVGVARAIATNPTFIVADEPVSSLDVSVRTQILNLFKDLRQQLKLTMLFITHELAVLRSLADRVTIMYLGKFVEAGDTTSLFEKPAHPYTRALLSATPIANPRAARSREKLILTGEVPSPIDPPHGCRFHPRCPWRSSKCSEIEPVRVEDNGRFYTCHHPLF